MLSGFGLVAEAAAANSSNCTCRKQIDNQQFLANIGSTRCAIAQSMSYLASALSPRPASIQSMQSDPTTLSSVFEGSTPEENSEEGEEGHDNDTRATSITEPEAKSRGRSCSSGNPRSKTTFRLAHPPPVSIHRQHLHIRPKVLLQLQRVSKTVRPKPVLEVLPSVVFAPRLARRFPRTFKSKAGLGADDLVIVSSENYDTTEAETRDPDELFQDTRWEEREIIGAICQPSKDKTGCRGKAEICLNNGAAWTASKLANGSYEFVSVDEHGLQTVARWVLKLPKQRVPSAQNRSRSPSLEERRFNFSVLNPQSRRHAVIATVDRHSIDVSDRYSNPPANPKPMDSPTNPTPLSATSEDTVEGQEAQSPYSWQPDIRTPRRISSYFPEVTPVSETPIEMDEPLRTLIIITGVWVAFQEGFSPNFNNRNLTHGQSAATRSGSKYQRRSLSMTLDQSSGAQSPSPAKSTFGNIQRVETSLQQVSSSDGVPLAQSSRPLSTSPRRSQSTSSAFMRRVTSRKNSTSVGDQLSSLGDIDSRGTDRSSLDGSTSEKTTGLRTQTHGNHPVSANGSPWAGRRTPSCQSTLDSPLEPVISHDLDPPEKTPVLSREVSRKPRRLGKFFGLRRRTGGGS
ncbi:hypothetical protein N7G274_006301 [Stereocaulon virgatum]|uniref:Uncharacterized protein n=1 Tax=Stereocaulon virgatum TaxID=373712 RepID=A0ABR4A5A0_9LECA